MPMPMPMPMHAPVVAQPRRASQEWEEVLRQYSCEVLGHRSQRGEQDLEELWLTISAWWWWWGGSRRVGWGMVSFYEGGGNHGLAHALFSGSLVRGCLPGMGQLRSFEEHRAPSTKHQAYMGTCG